MGIEYAIVCKTCRVKREVDKLREEVVPATSRQQAIDQSDKVDAFRCYLITSFLKEHEGHDCTLANDTSPELEDYYYGKDEEPIDFWQDDSHG